MDIQNDIPTTTPTTVTVERELTEQDYARLVKAETKRFCRLSNRRMADHRGGWDQTHRWLSKLQERLGDV